MDTVVSGQRPTLKEYDTLRSNITEAAKHARNLFVSHVTVNTYGILTVSTMEHAEILGASASVKLPVIDVSVSPGAFFVAVPVISVVVFLYFQVYLHHMWRLVRKTEQMAVVLQELGRPRDFVPADADCRYPWIAFISEGSGTLSRIAKLAFAGVSWLASPALFFVCAFTLMPFLSNLKLWLILDGAPSADAFLLAFVAFGGSAGVLFVKNVTLKMRWRVLVGGMTSVLLGFCSLFLGYAISTPLQLTNAEISRRPPRGGTVAVGARLSGAYLQGAKLQGAYLQRAELQLAYLQRAQLQGAELQGAELQGAELQGAKLQGAKLSGAELRGADLQGAKLSGAELRGAKLQSADLRGTDLQSADLRGADLQGAKLQWAKLSGADLRGALNVPKNAKHIVDEADRYTQWPEYIENPTTSPSSAKSATHQTETD